jgi:predicted O-methyltransferase YrrM
MGRGRAKAKQTKVARELKYHSPDTDLEALQRELSGNGTAGNGTVHHEEPDPYVPYLNEADEDDEPDHFLPRNDAGAQHARSLLGTLVSKLPQGILTDDRFFELYERKGWHVLPVGYYEPIPDTRELRDELWTTPSSMVGVEKRVEAQRAFLAQVADTYLTEYHAISDQAPSLPTEYTRATGFSGIDGAMLYSMIRTYKPRRMIEVGSGHSTLLSLQALHRNAEEDGAPLADFTAIEPYPADYLRKAMDGAGKLLERKVEDVPVTEFERLEENDILFVDSSHSVRIGGDVVYELLEIIPRLKKGVLVHIHDIFLPYEYPKEWIKKRFVFWTEQYLLHAFLAFNRAFEILWSGGIMRAHAPAELARHFPYYEPGKQHPGSFWLRRCE